MFTWLIRSSFRLMALAAIGFVAVTLPVGRRTLFEHADRKALRRNSDRATAHQQRGQRPFTSLD